MFVVTFIPSCTRALGDKDLWLSRNIYFSSFSFRALDYLKLMCFSPLVIFPATLKKDNNKNNKKQVGNSTKLTPLRCKAQWPFETDNLTEKHTGYSYNLNTVTKEISTGL